MLYSIGRFLQALGLFIILPAAVAGQALDKITVGQMLNLLVVGIVVFAVGWLIQQMGKPPP